MPNLKTASLRVAAYYLEILDGLNDDFQVGGEKQTLSIRRFDLERLNVLSARETLPVFMERYDFNRKMSDLETALLDVCNAYPDAGSYLISMKMSAVDRIQWLNDALKASRHLNNNITTQAHLGNLGLAYYELGELSQAEQYFLEALELAKQIDDKNHQGAWLGDLGNVYAMLGDHHKAIDFHKKHLELAHSINDERGEGHAVANLGVSYAYLGDVNRALEHYQRFLDISVKRGDRHEESQAYMNMGFAYYDLGFLADAENSLNIARQIAMELGDLLTQCLVLGGLADIELDRKEFPHAIQLLTQSMDLLRDVYDVRTELRLLQSLGNAYMASDDWHSALTIYSRLYTSAEAVGAPAAMCSALANQVSLHRHMGNLETASEIGEKTLKIAAEIDSLSDEAFVRWQLGLIHETRGDKDRAVPELQRAIEIETQIGSLLLDEHQAFFEELVSTD